MKIFVERVLETTEADLVTIPTSFSSEGTKYREIPGERRQAVEVSVRAIVEDPGEIDTWREQVGRTLNVVPWEQSFEVGGVLLPAHYEMSFTRDGHVVLLCEQCNPLSADIVHEWGDEYQEMVPIRLITAAALAHEKEHHDD